MADLTQSLLQAISIIADKSAEEISSDKTIKAVVKKNISTSEGKYLVTYNSGDFYAYLQSGSKDVYQIGEQVYVLVPEGDMSQKKFIIGKIKNEEEYTSKTLTSSLLNDYVTIGSNIVIDNGYTENNSLDIKRMQPLPLDSHAISDFYYCYLRDKSEVEELSSDYDSIKYPVIKIDEEVFQNSAKQAKALLIRAEFKTNINTQNIGHYGLIVNIAFADKTNPKTDDNNNIIYPPKLVSYILDTSKMTGNPMKFYDYTSQYMIAAFDGMNYLYIDSIVAFSEGFVNEKISEYDENDDTHIYIDNIEIIALDEISAINGDYKLKLTTPQGNTIREGERGTLRVLANVSYLNQDITKETVFNWGVKDPSITISHPDYNAKLGPGYKYFDIKENELILTPATLSAAENMFVCVAIYKSNIILKTSVLLYNNNNKLNITIESDQGTKFQFNEGNPTLTCLINNRLNNYQDNYPDEAFSFIWSKEDTEMGSILLNKTEAQLEADKEEELRQLGISQEIPHVSNTGRTATQILSYYSTQIAQVKDIIYPNGVNGPKIKCSLKNTNTYVIYSCSVYRAGIYVGYASITLQNSKDIINNNYYITITNGTQVFQYDESGIAPNSIKRKEPIEVLDLIAVFHNPQGVEVTPKKVRWVIPQGNTLINIPTLGLETDPETGERYFVGDIYPLSIKENYDNTCNDNQITVVVTHTDGSEYRQSSNLLFTKIGEIGTNGTDTVVKINEKVNVPKEECLTIIKTTGLDAKYNTGDNIYNTPILEASLYTSNTQVLGHTTQWTIAGTSETQGRNYKVKTKNDLCEINYDGKDDKLDTRIVRAQTSLNGKYFYNFYGIPAIEYASGYDDNSYPIKIMRDGTLKNILYNSNGENPSYNENQGVHVELPDWPQTGYLEWEVQSGVENNDGIYDNPNFLLSKTPKSKTGSKKLIIENDIASIQSNILNIQDISNTCIDSASVIIKDYISEFLTDIEKIGIDIILSTSNKLDALWNRSMMFLNQAPDKENIYIRTVYEKYTDLFNQMIEEYNDCKNINEKSTSIYNKIQEIWNSEWPSVIINTRLHTQSNSGITTIEQLNDMYKSAYDDRSNEDNAAIVIPARSTIFDSFFISLIGNELDKDSDNAIGLDKYYRDYINFLGEDAIESHYILVEYAKVLMTYLNIIVNETQQCFVNDNNTFQDLYNEIRSKYDIAYNDWNISNNSGDNYLIGENIYNVITSGNETEAAANIYNNMRELYKYYKRLYLNVKKYQIAEESKTLNVWHAMLNGQEPDLLNQIYVVPNEVFNGLYMNNNVVGTAFIKNNNNKIEIAKIYVPIIMTINTYELAALNGWDGTSVEIGDDHIMTPQIGAGIKDSITNNFTGMVMGVIGNTAVDDKSKLNKTEKVGLIGYSNGKQSVFIDSETGAAYFGLPENDVNVLNNVANDANATIGTNEGRIELIPGGVSKISNWKIGSRFLYNIVNGNYERRNDSDVRGSDKSKLMIPHDKHGIILSSDKPYIHVKSEVYSDKNLKGINYQDEYNNINPGDSLELRMDPNNKSLFSIVQHTAGFGNEENDNLFFGYKSTYSSQGRTIVKNYIANQNIEETNIKQADDTNTEYYVYGLATNSNGYIPYDINEIESGINKIDSSSWTAITPSMYNGEMFLKDALPWNHFTKTTTATTTLNTGPVFSIDDNTGMITYNPGNLIWKDESNYQVIGFSNNNGWQSITEEISTENPFSIEFKYNKEIENSPDKNTRNIQIGQIRNSTGYKVYRIKIKDCTIHTQLTGMNFNDPANTYVQFYIVSEQNEIINNALLVSDMINIWDNQDNLDIELSSFNNNGLSNGSTFWLKMKVYLNTFTINSNCSCTVEPSSSLHYKVPPIAPYGTIKITSTTSSNGVNFTTSEGSLNNISGQYKFYKPSESSKWRLQFKINSSGQTVYDFVLWRQGNYNTTAAGQTIINNWAKFFTKYESSLDSLSDFIELEIEPSVDNPWCISFYTEEYCTTENVYYSNISSFDSSDGNTLGINEFNTIVIVDPETGEEVSENTTSTITGTPDIIDSAVIDDTTSITLYKLADNYDEIIVMTNKDIYNDINWNNWDTESGYSSARVSWGLVLENLTFGNISAFIPEMNTTKLCVEEDSSINSIQGICYAKTYWKQNGSKIEQWVRFFIDYYRWVNNPINNKIQYGYIDIAKDEDNIYYKYIKTIAKQKVNAWFNVNNTSLSNNNHSTTSTQEIWNWIEFSLDDLKNDSYWKEFIRVGLDENGRFFSAGLQDKKTYGRTGKIFSFGKVPKLYGQEVRTELSSNRYAHIIKIFTQITDSKTTYITQGQNDDGNISIRTAGNNHYVELAASQFSNNRTNSIPDKTNYIQVSHNKGIKIQANSGNSLINLTNTLSIMTNAILIQNTSSMSNFKLNITDNYMHIKSSSYIVSSLNNSTAGLNDNDYRIRAFNDNNSNPTIRLEIGKKGTGLDLTPSKIILKSNRNRYIEINSQDESISSFNIDNMKILFNSTLNNQTITLTNSGTYIKIQDEKEDSDQNIARKRDILLHSGLGSEILISKKITIKSNAGLTINGNSSFNNNVYVKSNLYSGKNLYIGYNNEDKESTAGTIFLYNDNNKHYVRISASDLKQLFDWYNKYRWGIGYFGNTVILRNVGGSSSNYQYGPEGTYIKDENLGKNVYRWDLKRFRRYANWD